MLSNIALVIIIVAALALAAYADVLRRRHLK